LSIAVATDDRTPPHEADQSAIRGASAANRTPRTIHGFRLPIPVMPAATTETSSAERKINSMTNFWSCRLTALHPATVYRARELFDRMADAF
jgi:hypothetical protein